MPNLRAKTGANKGKIYEIPDVPLSIGRDENQAIQILDQGVSRAHAEIFRMGGTCYVRDLSSTNGTFVNGVKVTEEDLSPGDELLVGTTIMVFEDAEAPQGAAAVEFDGDEGSKLCDTTVEMRIGEAQPTGAVDKVLGREVHSRNLVVIGQIGRIVREDRDLRKVFEKVMEVVGRAMGALHGYLLALSAEGDKLSARAIFEAENAEAERKVSRTIVTRVRTTGMPLLTTDAALDGRFALSESVILRKIRSVICVPLPGSDRVDGVLYFHSSKMGGSFGVEDLELATAAALQLSLASAGVQANERLRKGMLGTIRALVTAMEIVDPKNQGHARRVADCGAAVAIQMGLPKEEVDRIRLASLLHDVGKLAVHHTSSDVPKANLLEEHVFAGEKILTGIDGADQVLPGVRYHHERADGSGFPYRVKNAETPVMARVLIVANAFDNACVAGGTPPDVVRNMEGLGGTEFDGDVVKALAACHKSGIFRSVSAAPPSP